MKRLESKVALVTGAGRGIGAAIAKKIAGDGATVYINYASSGEAAKNTATEIENAGGIAKIYKCDISNYDDTKAMIEKIIADEGRLDILVNNAGITKDNIMMRMTPEEFDIVININLKGAFNTMQIASKYMIKKRAGRIINISSVSGVMGNVGQINYAASKAGIIGMTKAAAREVAGRNITVNAIAPGYIKTDMTDAMTDNAKAKLKELIPLGHHGEPEDVANMVAFLAGEEGRYITGQVIRVDGGMSM